MAHIRILIEDDNGQLLTPATQHVYRLEGACDTLDAIETAVEAWRKHALPAVEKTLLTYAQAQVVAKKKRP